jgi:hypothetical protein
MKRKRMLTTAGITVLLGCRGCDFCPGKIQPQNTEWARVLRVQGLRKLASNFY